MTLAFTTVILVSLIQGITEFLPVSSSGHLVLLPALTTLEDQGQLIDVAAHIGTLCAVMVYLRRDIWALALCLFCSGPQHQAYRHLMGSLFIASIPVILAGLALELTDPDILRLAIIVAIANLIFALLLGYADRRPARFTATNGVEDKTRWTDLSYSHALYIGLAQICALIPGASRSGVTMTMARQLGYDRLTAARFSLLLSVPVIAGAGLLKSLSLYRNTSQYDLTSALWVAGLSCLCALIAIRWMMGWLSHADFKIFVIYRVILGVVLLALLGMGIL